MILLYFRFTIFFILSLWFSVAGAQQKAILQGYVYGDEEQTLFGAGIMLPDQNLNAITNAQGFFKLQIPDVRDSVRLRVSYVGYLAEELVIKLNSGEEKTIRVQLKPVGRVLGEVTIRDSRRETLREQSSTRRLKPKDFQNLTSPFGDISAVLATLPGVTQNNELSSSYSVRGGNFDENLVYVNEIPVYRPFLVRAGQQEGLGFVNPDLIQHLSFSSGGWQAKWGDKLSSVLNIEYKEPDSTAASVTGGLLGGAVHLEGANRAKSFTYVTGIRHKSSQYLLNTLDTKGEYLPKFTDIQSFLTYKINPSTELSLLLSYARNRYLVAPVNRQTTFGTMVQAIQLNVGFDGKEVLHYDMWQNAIKLSNRWSDSFRTSWIASYLNTTEREYVDLEGGYRLCNIDPDPESSSFNECLTVLGIGTDYQNIRNLLHARIFNLQSRNEWKFSKGQLLEFGLQYGQENVQDRLREWGFADSADFVKIKEGKRITNDIALNNQRMEGYVQNTSILAEGIHTLHYGFRFHYFNLNKQWLLSPRIQYAFRPIWLKDVVFTAASGFYHQPPLYREFRSPEGQIRPGVLAQSSFHLISGADLNFTMWDRIFNFVSEVYYKKLWNVNAYDVENVRIRYFANNESVAYATGTDLRLSGEFIPGAESWFSLGVMKTAEDIPGDSKGFIRRPSDQRVNLGIFFQDHLPNDPSVRVYVKTLYGSGLPFGPGERIEFRNIYSGRSYKRVDIGFSKILRPEFLQLKNLWIGLEVLNLLGNNNVISYSWISDFNNNQYAVPNTLSSRFYNLKVVAHW